MDWVQFATFIVVNTVFTLTLWLWNRTESRADIRRFDANMDAMRLETNTLVRAIHEEIRSFQSAMALESKDFHGRLCAIEERSYKNRGTPNNSRPPVG